jgi:PAS domain-containing protein
MSLAGVFDVVALGGFVTAALLFGLARRSGPPAPARGRVLVIVALGLLTLVSASNVLENLEITERFDPAEDYLEVAVFPVFGYALYVMWASEHMEKLRLSQRHAMAEHDMLMGIVDASPMGIVVVNEQGCLAFANQPAWDALGLGECEGPH